MTGPAYVYAATVDRIVDGDTYHLRIDLGFHVAVTLPVRLRGVDCPEMNTPEGRAARTFVIALLVGRPLLVQSYRDRQSFARWVADVWVDEGAGWDSVADVLLGAGHAVPLDAR